MSHVCTYVLSDEPTGDWFSMTLHVACVLAFGIGQHTVVTSPRNHFVSIGQCEGCACDVQCTAKSAKPAKSASGCASTAITNGHCHITRPQSPCIDRRRTITEQPSLKDSFASSAHSHQAHTALTDTHIDTSQIACLLLFKPLRSAPTPKGCCRT
jgi:hypothetical protein